MRAGDADFSCAVPTASAWLRGLSDWANVQSSSTRFRRTPANPTGQGPLRMGIDVYGIQTV